MPITFEERMQQNRRLCVLKTLADMPGFRANESLIHQTVVDFAFPATRDQIRSDLTWLKEQGLVTIDVVCDVMIGAITGRGEDVAAGRAIVPGVQRPQPK